MNEGPGGPGREVGQGEPRGQLERGGHAGGVPYGYRSVPAAKGSVVFYGETALTVLLGALFAGESFTARFAAGFALILAGLWLNQSRLGPGRGRAGRAA